MGVIAKTRRRTLGAAYAASGVVLSWCWRLHRRLGRIAWETARAEERAVARRH